MMLHLLRNFRSGVWRIRPLLLGKQIQILDIPSIRTFTQIDTSAGIKKLINNIFFRIIDHGFPTVWLLLDCAFESISWF